MNVPAFLYGTAWKEDETERLTHLALKAGFRGVDTANQRKHYHEAGVGAGIARAVQEGIVTRDDLFIQTKFTYVDGQDHRLPYDPRADHTTQVRQSFASSLEHLGVEALDSYVLHGPSRRRGLAPIDWEVWRAMEALHAAGAVRYLGISNAALDQIEELCAGAEVRPAFVQNRCFASNGWDYAIRKFCREEKIVYQGFSLLTANVRELQRPGVREIAMRHDATLAQLVFRFAVQVGMLPLTGTTSEVHMRDDLAIDHFELSSEEIAAIERVAV